MNQNDPEALERRSESIRADVGQTLDALQRNYSPTALVDRSMDLLHDHGGQMATNILEHVRRNPMPVLLMAVGAAWMVAAQTRSAREDASSHAKDGRGEHENLFGSIDSSDSGSDSGISNSSGGVEGSLAGAREKLKDATQSATETVSEGARKLTERSRSIAESAREKSRHASAAMTRLLHEQPFAVGAAGIAIGALIGTLLPETAQEDRLLGPARDRAVRKARSAGEEGFESARHKVHEVVDRTTESLRSGGGRDDGQRDGAATSGGTTPA
jgi:ElaB/YqjD/DUF883 family membrane-anchored ribosome-binding protein